MSTSPESDFDLEKLFLPAWAKEAPQPNRYAKYEGESERGGDRRQDRHDRPGRRPGPPGFRPGPAGSGQPRPGRPRPPHREGRPDRDRDRGRPAPLPPPAPLPEINVTFVPDDYGVDLLAKQIRITGRAFPLFDIAQLVLQKPERHHLTFSTKKKADGTVAQPLYLCALDDTLWLSENDAVQHVLNRHFATFYQADRTQIDPPKGTYTFVAQCGMSGVILGPPNYHDYQNQLRKLHAERFGRMPFEAFKAKVRIVKDPEVVKKWVEEQSWKTEYVCLNLPEPLRLGTREDVEKHFRELHLPNIIKPLDSHRLSGVASRNLRDRELQRLVRQRWDEQRRFPIQVATVLSQQFATRGLQFFKVNKTVTHVAVARPHFLDLETTPVSDCVRRIVDFINSHPKCTHKQLLTTLAPSPAPPPKTEPVGTPSASGEGVASASPGATAEASVMPEPTPEMTAVMTDLHWLIHQGHVIEFANGVLETAKRPLPKPPKPAPREAKAAPPAEATETTPAGATTDSPPIGGGESTGEGAGLPAPGEAQHPATSGGAEALPSAPMSDAPSESAAPPEPTADPSQ